jgi:hypothetical protein
MKKKIGIIKNLHSTKEIDNYQICREYGVLVGVSAY